MKWYLSWPVLLLIALLVTPATRAASDTQLELKILPIDCIFEIVDDGTGEIVYLTPEECGQLIDSPPDSFSPPEESDINTFGPGTGAATPPYSYLAPFVDIDSNDVGSSSDASDDSQEDKEDSQENSEVDSTEDLQDSEEQDEKNTKLPLLIAFKAAAISIIIAAWWNGWGWFKGFRK